MDTKSINKVLQKERCFVGTFPVDKIPIPRKLPYAVVVNTDASDKPGQHWVAIFIAQDGLGEYFDSFGFSPLDYRITNFLNNNAPKGWLYNANTFQHILSQSCGQYCILFIRLRARNFSFCTFMYLFTNSKTVNDFIVNYSLSLI